MKILGKRVASLAVNMKSHGYLDNGLQMRKKKIMMLIILTATIAITSRGYFFVFY